MTPDAHRFIERSARDAIIKRQIRLIENRIKADYKPRLKAATDPQERQRLETEMHQLIRTTLKQEGLIDPEAPLTDDDIRDIENRIKAQYKPRLDAATDPHEKTRLQTQMHHAIAKAILRESSRRSGRDSHHLY